MTRVLFLVMERIGAVDARAGRSSRRAGGGRSLGPYLMPPAKPWMKRFWAKR
ncbi:hypothetical protein GCM10027261_21340 [Geodermatophilus arenarius]